MKSPAILFYTSDFLTGTMLMNDEQVGIYIRLLCYQHQQGHITEEDMKMICKSYDKKIYDKFIKDESGNYYNERMDLEIEKRNAYSQSRSQNRKTTQEHMNNICKSYDKHMENENININSNNYIKLGLYKRILLTNKQYEKLIEEYGKEYIDNQITLLDEYIQINNNKQKYKDFNLVLRKSIRENWFIEKKNKSSTEKMDEVFEKFLAKGDE